MYSHTHAQDQINQLPVIMLQSQSDQAHAYHVKHLILQLEPILHSRIHLSRSVSLVLVY